MRVVIFHPLNYKLKPNIELSVQHVPGTEVGLCMSHLVRVHQSGVWEVERGNEQPHTLALDPVTIQVISNDPGHEVSCLARPAVEGEGERLVGLWVVDKTLDGFQDHGLSQVLPVEASSEGPSPDPEPRVHKQIRGSF